MVSLEWPSNVREFFSDNEPRFPVMGSLTHSPTVRYPLSSDAVNELIKARGTAKGPGGQAITSIEKWIQAAIDGKPEVKKEPTMTAGRRQALAIGAADKKRRDMQFDVDSNETHCAYIQNELRSHLDKRDMARNNLNVAKNDFNNVSVEVAKIFEEHKQLIDKAAKLTPIIHAASAIRHGMASKHHDAEAKLHEVEEALRRLTSLSIRKNKERDAAKERLAAAEREERQILARK